ncbi:MAG TPA: prenyltransferase/squalene oxidase repeat-containing protein [Gemmataceae bacterium]|jgi:squalene-hopene/tetraprenyl-beta-curcumene cyclase|nr:prenyltransferase/squalene oxidase repeat-containing protein [Gemmataceae bacterium]
MQDCANFDQLTRAHQIAVTALLAERNSAGFWTGELSTSALSTATAVSALALVQKNSDPHGRYNHLITQGLAWLTAHQNPDGGWGDTTKSISNISTSMLCRAAFHIAGAAEGNKDCLGKVVGYLQEHCGKTPEDQAEAVRARYGKDRTFAVPILTTCALAGLVSWKEVKPLPFELACFPQSWFRFLRIPVVSYALPALIAIGQAVYHHRPPINPVTRMMRRLSISKSLRVLKAIQPSSGGFLEATPLTSFVTLSLASISLAQHVVTRRAVDFLAKSVREDGSWPIDSNLATWVTTLSINALASAEELDALDTKQSVREWLLMQQYSERHPYTGAEPGAWAWTDLPGGVPDADDTPGALLALHQLGLGSETPAGGSHSVTSGLRWLCELQNRDGGIPTFCRGWGHLPFDRSGADLTAHALRAFGKWRPAVEKDWLQLLSLRAWGAKVNWSGLPLPKLDQSIAGGLRYLQQVQRADGSWLPLWFGNQYAANDENPTYGTARVLAAYRDLDKMNTEPARRGVAWLLSAQNADGGWGGAAGVLSSMEETALAVEVLLDAGVAAESTVNKGLAWLVEQVEAGGLHNPTPIGFYFAKLWYFEKLYPIIFTVAALGRALRKLSHRCEPARPTDSP